MSQSSIKCFECEYDLSLLFGFNTEDDSLKVVIASCPDCNTVCKAVRKNRQWITEAATKKVSKPLPLGPNFDTYVPLTVEQKASLENERLNKYKARCMKCSTIISLFLSYLVRLQTNIFPRKDEIVINRMPDGLEVEEVVTTYLPPIKQKGRLCKKCYDEYSLADFSNRDIETLPDPENMMRDGLRNIKASNHTPKFEVSIDRTPRTQELPSHGVSDETPSWFKRIHGRDGEIESRVTFTSLTSQESLAKQVVKKNYPLRPSKINVQLHPSRRVRKINIPSYKGIDFTPRDRRQSFKRWFEHG